MTGALAALIGRLYVFSSTLGIKEVIEKFIRLPPWQNVK
jgi:hypothetical protein